MTLRTSRRPRLLSIAAIAASAAIVLSACSSSPAEEPEGTTDSASTVSITDNYGTVEVPVNPKTVVALDNHVFETLDSWNVELAAAPKGIMGSVWPNYSDDDSVVDIGSHREPNLEAIVAAEPDLIIAGYRFGDAYDDIKAQNPNAAVIDIAPREGEDLMSELQRTTTILGQIFDHEDDAKALNTKLDDAIAGAKDAYNGTDTVMAVNTSGGKIGYLAPGIGRSVGPVFGALGLTPALEVEGASSDHQGDDISVEAIAASNPEWIIALDRDAAFAPEDRDEGSAPAAELIAGSEALKNVPAVTKGNIVYLDANFYLTEDIQAYTELFERIQDAFAAA
ncbi:siderophore ABC transporter substrate-binding protein [Leucobacter komagatae]|uniref:Iron ABC transporter substrate-binding protein n=1 Tax=Leucobacter komagatae TaxID=55969 RepID=A0A0D0IMF1_9MICO|nr:ABC transporter substrate-binding protein [Leucobacter komagatae]KIP52774.1 iron ABC transporter substrate-binding protein [Leucobacter komagatae]